MSYYKTSNKKRYSLILLPILMYAKNVLADFPKTELEFAQLPPFCTARSSPGKPEYILWEKKQGSENFIHIHHYCSALNGINKAYSLKEPFRTRMLEESIGGIDYVLENANKNFYLFPELHLKKAEIYILLNTKNKAVTELNTAIKINPKYTPPYYYLSKIYKEDGDKKKAIDILNLGLQSKPDSKLLNNNLAKLKNEK